MKQYFKHIIAKRGINFYIACKAMIKADSDKAFSMYYKFKLCAKYGYNADDVCNDLSLYLSMRKDFSQY